MTAPRRLRQIPANGRRLPPPFRPVLPVLLSMGNSIHKSVLELSGRRTGARALGRGCAPVVIRPPGKAGLLPLAAQLPNDPGDLLSCGRVRSPPGLSSVSYPALDHPSAPRTASPGRLQAELSGDPGDPHARQAGPVRFRPVWAHDYAGSVPP